MAEKFPKLKKETDIQAQKAQRVPVIWSALFKALILTIDSLLQVPKG